MCPEVPRWRRSIRSKSTRRDRARRSANPRPGSKVPGLVDGSTFERPIHAGSAIQRVKSSDAKTVTTIRTATFDAAGKGGNAPVEKVSASVDGSLSAWGEDKAAPSDRSELTSAGIVVPGGRGVGSHADFALIERLSADGGSATPWCR